MKRFIDTHLLQWKQDPRRKVLLLRGARQVGKTYSVRELGKTFEYYVEINFDETPEIAVAVEFRWAQLSIQNILKCCLLISA